jgi:hypothetical protein
MDGLAQGLAADPGRNPPSVLKHLCVDLDLSSKGEVGYTRQRVR